MSHFDTFFRDNYLRIVRYVANYHAHFRHQDAEEVAADVIHKNYYEYRARIEGPSPDTTMRRWMIRRAVLNMLSRYELREYSRYESLPDDHDALSFDDPADIICLPNDVPDVLCEEPADRAAQHRYSRAKLKFMKELRA
jgi:hypothetical protein